MRRTLAALAAAALLAAPMAALSPSEALAQQQADGLVVVQVGDITVEDVNVGVAAQVVALLCDAVDANVAVVAIQTIDRQGGERTVCTVDDTSVAVSQN